MKENDIRIAVSAISRAADRIFLAYDIESDVCAAEAALHLQVGRGAERARIARDREVSRPESDDLRDPSGGRILSCVEADLATAVGEYAEELLSKLGDREARAAEQAIQQEILYRAAIAQARCVEPPGGWDMFGR